MESQKSDDFKDQMRKAMGKGSDISPTPKKKKLGHSIDVSLPTKKPRKSGYLSCRCTRETEEIIANLMEKTGLSQSVIVNHLVESALPALKSQYLDD